jgi:hypothetical protein
VLKHNVSLHEEYNQGKELPENEVPTFDRDHLQMKLAELEQVNYAINIDLRREREARRLVQEQLFFSQSTRGYRGELRKPASPPASPSSASTFSPQRPSTPKLPIVAPGKNTYF